MAVTEKKPSKIPLFWDRDLGFRGKQSSCTLLTLFQCRRLLVLNWDADLQFFLSRI